jgi:hypothetical protein
LACSPLVNAVPPVWSRVVDKRENSADRIPPGLKWGLSIMTKQSIWAILAGVLFIIIVTTLVDIALHVAGVFPPMNQPINDALSLLATSYRIVISVGGAWLTARLAPNKPMKHAMILGYVGVALGLVGVVATWNLGLGPRWYPISLVVLAIPQCWAGGKLYEMQSANRAPTA